MSSQVGWAKTGQPVIYSDIGLAKDRSVPGNLEHCVQTLESAIATIPEGVETYIWVSDFHGFGFSDCDPRMAAGCLQLFAQNYPERMGKFIMVDAPYIFHKMYKLLAPYVDPVTAAKLSFVQGPSGKGGGAELRAALGEMFDDELVEWMLVEMAENRCVCRGRWVTSIRCSSAVAYALALVCFQATLHLYSSMMVK